MVDSTISLLVRKSSSWTVFDNLAVSTQQSALSQGKCPEPLGWLWDEIDKCFRILVGGEGEGQGGMPGLDPVSALES
jgi:hypothetical protein